MLNSRDKIEYISYIGDIEILETAIIRKIEGNKVYCVDEYNSLLIFCSETGYCYNDNPTFNAKKIMNIING